MFQPLEHEAIDGGATPTTRSGGSCADAEAICTCRTSANFTQIVRFRKMKSWRRFIKFPMKSTVKLSFKGSDHGIKDPIAFENTKDRVTWPHSFPFK